MGIVLFKKYFQSCIALVGQGRLLCRRSCVSLMGGFIGTSSSVACTGLGGGSVGFVLGYSLFHKCTGFGANKVCWKPVMSKGFEVRGFYHALSPSSDILFP